MERRGTNYPCSTTQVIVNDSNVFERRQRRRRWRRHRHYTSAHDYERLKSEVTLKKKLCICTSIKRLSSNECTYSKAVILYKHNKTSTLCTNKTQPVKPH